MIRFASKYITPFGGEGTPDGSHIALSLADVGPGDRGAIGLGDGQPVVGGVQSVVIRSERCWAQELRQANQPVERVVTVVEGNPVRQGQPVRRPSMSYVQAYSVPLEPMRAVNRLAMSIVKDVPSAVRSHSVSPPKEGRHFPRSSRLDRLTGPCISPSS